jgi:transcriptional regulator of acetoin/glycerol metabolism
MFMGWSNQLSHIKKINSDWGKFITSGDMEGVQVRPHILRSWQRCYTSGVSPMRWEAPTELNPAQLKEELQCNWSLVEAASPILKELGQHLNGTGQILILTNARATIIDVVGDQLAFKRAAGVNLQPGSNISETSHGTNAPGLAIAERQPLTVFASEHYCEGPKEWSCTSAPILYAIGQKIQGTLTLSGRYMVPNDHSSGLIISATRVIEERLFQQYLQRRSEVLMAYTESILRIKADLIAALDHNGSLLEVSSYQHPLLAIDSSAPAMIPDLQTCIQRILSNPMLACTQMDRIELPDHQRYTLTYRAIFKNQTFYGLLLFAHTAAPRRPTRHSSGKSDGALVSGEAPGSLDNAPFHRLVGSSPTFKQALELAMRSAVSKAAVLIQGETGVGKEGFAQAIHQASSRSQGAFVAVNCGAIPKELIASELFGYAPGSFTGALAGGSSGKFESAHNGTIFLDEVSELPLDMQPYLLRVLQEKEITRLGTHKPIPIDTRVISATQCDLQQLVAKGRFRQDLYYRLNIVEIKVPPLRERPEDFPHLIIHFLDTFGLSGTPIREETLQALITYHWPGNVRELMNLIERASVLSQDADALLLEYVQSRLATGCPTPDSVNQPEQTALTDRIAQTLAHCSGNVSLAAKELGIGRSTIYRHLKEKRLILDRNFHIRK